jgi:hypothetical protein
MKLMMLDIPVGIKQLCASSHMFNRCKPVRI